MTKNQPKVAVVTGAASGIGRATVTTLLNQGFQVAAIDVDTAGPVSYTHLTLPTICSV